MTHRSRMPRSDEVGRATSLTLTRVSSRITMRGPWAQAARRGPSTDASQGRGGRSPDGAFVGATQAARERDRHRRPDEAEGNCLHG